MSGERKNILFVGTRGLEIRGCGGSWGSESLGGRCREREGDAVCGMLQNENAFLGTYCLGEGS